MNEAQRQQWLFAALTTGAVPAAPVPNAALSEAWLPEAALRETGARAARGLEAYRANAEGIAERALAATFPTVQAMLGVDDFGHLARAFRLAHPPERGDLGEWGDALPAWLEAHAGLAAWPWLGDCARLDFALHRCERAADAVPELESLRHLETDDPSRLRLLLPPGSAVLRSDWPLDAIHHAHRLAGDAAERAFAQVREKVAARHGETVFVVRHGWRAAVHGLDAPTADWLDALLAGADLERALACAGATFDFAAWLGTALRESWVKGVVASND